MDGREDGGPERERDELLSENADLRLTLTKDGLLGRMEEAERLGYEIGRNCAEAERHMLKAERDALKCCGNCEYGSLEDCGFILGERGRGDAAGAHGRRGARGGGERMSYRPSYPGDRMATTEGARRANVRPRGLTPGWR